jgi:hypothetical protein
VRKQSADAAPGLSAWRIFSLPSENTAHGTRVHSASRCNFALAPTGQGDDLAQSGDCLIQSFWHGVTSGAHTKSVAIVLQEC